MFTPDEERMWVIGIVLVCTLLFAAYATYEILRPVRTEKTTTSQQR